MKVEIKHRHTGAVIYTANVPDDTPSGLQMRAALEQATQARANLAGAYLADANLAGANLADAYLAGAYLADANLADANLAGAYLAGANLAGANLADAYLADAYLAGAYLADANLAGANLADAYLAGANLAGAKWRDGISISKQPIQLCGLLWTVTILDAHMQIGCELHSMAQWAEYDDARICQMDRQALRFWREHKEAILSLARATGRSFEANEATAQPQ